MFRFWCWYFSQIWCTPKRARAIVVVVCLAAAGATLPEFFECRVIDSPAAHSGNSTLAPPPSTVRLQVVKTDFGNTWAYSFFYRYANQALFTFVPLLLLLVFNTLLISAVLTAARRRQQMAKTGRELAAAADRQDRQRKGQQRITVSLSITLTCNSVVVVIVIGNTVTVIIFITRGGPEAG